MKTATALLVFCAALAAQNSNIAEAVKVTRIPATERALKFEVLVPAPLGDVWNAFTTSAGLSTWLWKDCAVDLREGGGWMVHYPGGATGGGTIVSFEPGRRLAIHALAPEKFPEVRRLGTTAVFEFASEGTGTRVTLTQTGWKQGKEWDDAYDYLATGNAQLLGQLRLRFAKGPLAWR
jgi:uncharacterized protein YndB with AHSA1/START domain